MKLGKGSVLTALFTSVIFSSQVQAATLSPGEQVDRVVSWFTGSFNNSQQASTEPEVPFITMENCAANTFGGVVDLDSQYVHLEQYIGGVSLLRSAGYEFSPISSGVSLQVYSYSDRDAAIGTCDNANPNINLSNLANPSCDLELAYEPERFFGTNSPTGCPSSFPAPGSSVVSTVEITANEVNALDQFFLPDSSVFGTEIEFQRVATTNEPIGAIALLTLGVTGLIKSRYVKK